MIQNLINNWRTTSLGLSSILFAIVNLAFAVKKGNADQTAWTFAITQILTGVGVMLSRDQAASKVDKDQTASDIATLKTAVKTTADAAATAVDSGDTAQLKRMAATIPTGQPTPKP